MGLALFHIRLIQLTIVNWLLNEGHVPEKFVPLRHRGFFSTCHRNGVFKSNLLDMVCSSLQTVGKLISYVHVVSHFVLYRGKRKIFYWQRDVYMQLGAVRAFEDDDKQENETQIS